MRRTCLNAVHELADRDPRVVFIGSDITKRELARFQAAHPTRYFMEGVYEQHLIGMAAGMAMSGKIPYLNTIATFLTRRCYEQLLVDLGVHDLPVRLIGSGGGAVYAPLGVTHMANEDIAILRAIPHMTIIAPCDAEEMKRLMPLTLDWPHPIYIRMAKGGDTVVSSDAHPFRIGQAIPLREGRDVTFIATGITTQIALEAATALAAEGLHAGVLHVHTLKPLDESAILERVAASRAIVTVEEHRASGGLGSAVAELIADAAFTPGKPFVRIGFPDVFTEEHGSQGEIMKKYGITAESLAARALRLLGA